CCDSKLYRADSPEGAGVLSAHGTQGISGEKLVATGCGSYGLLGISDGSTCNQAPVCCEGNSFGLIGVGCNTIPITI
ncbi:hypothetical protein WOLCODRAFT_78828, partial [Wolfiporia cocos MD-104 SS10]